MNVEEYFPEGLSVIENDDSQLDVLKEVHRLGCTVKNSKFKSAVDIPTKPLNLHCHICYKPVDELIDNAKYVKPCGCSQMFLHSSCAAQNRKELEEANCSNCGSANAVPKNFLDHLKSSAMGKLFTSSKKVRSIEDNCVICRGSKYSGKQSKCYEKLVNPCFCGAVAHMGCLAPLNGSLACGECGVVFQSFQAASGRQYVRSNIFFYLAYILFIALATSLFFLAFINSSIISKRTETREIMLSIMAAFFSIVVCFSIIFVVRYTVFTAIPKYRITHGTVLLRPYRTPSPRKSLRPTLSRIDEFEEIALEEMNRKSSGTEDENDPVEEARDATTDLTLGQHLFGVYGTHHSSSTPIEKPDLQFVFNSV